MRWYVEYQIGGENAQHHELTGFKQAILGTTSQTQLRLPTRSGFAGSTLYIEPKTEGVLLRCTGSGALLIEYNGQRYQEFCMPWEQDVFVGAVRLCFLQIGEGGKTRGNSVSGVLMALLLAFSAFGFWGILNPNGESLVANNVPEAPNLWSKDGIICPLSPRDLNRDRLLELRQLALGKFSRYPFDGALGVDAVRLLEETKACYLGLKEISLRLKDEQTEIDEQLVRLRTVVESDYKSLQLSLEFARKQRNFAEVTVFSSKLLELIRLPQGHPYVRWLSSVIREATDELRSRVTVSD
jgi:hypothetical protein